MALEKGVVDKRGLRLALAVAFMFSCGGGLRNYSDL